MAHRITFPNGTVFETDDPELAWKAMERANSLAVPIAPSAMGLPPSTDLPSLTGAPPGHRAVLAFTPDGVRTVYVPDEPTAPTPVESSAVSIVQRFRDFWSALTDDQRALLRYLRQRPGAVTLRDLHAAVGKKELQGFAVQITNISNKAVASGFADGDVIRRLQIPDRRDPTHMFTGKRTAAYQAGAALTAHLSPSGELL